MLHQAHSSIRFQKQTSLAFPLHLHDVLEVVFLHRGSARVLGSAQSLLLQAGDVFVSFPDQPHGYEELEPVTCDVLIVPSAFLPAWRSLLLQRRPAESVLRQGQWEHTGLQTLLELLRSESADLSEPLLQGYATVIAGKLLPCLQLVAAPDGGNDTLHRLLVYVNQHYREPLTRAELAGAVGYNESYVSHLFSRQLGTTLTDYITALRLRDARALLQEADMTVSQLCLLLGFGSIRSFNRAFLKAYGCAPSELRKNTLRDQNAPPAF